MRRLAVTLCAIACIVGMLTGVIFTYASRVILNAGMFSERVADSLGEPPVARVVAGQITDQILKYRRDLTPFRPVVLGTVQQIIASTPFRAVVRQAALRLHPAILGGAETLALNLGDLRIVVQQALATLPGLQNKLPEQARFIVGSSEGWPAGRKILGVLRILQRMGRRGPIYLALGIVAGAIGFSLTRRRDRYLLRLGLGLTISALLVGVLARFGGQIFASLARSEITSDLLRGLWPVFLGPLALRMIILGGLGITLIASATSLLEEIDPVAFLASVWLRARSHPARAGAVILRGFLLLWGGIVIALHPREALEVGAVLAGGIVFFIGIQDVFTTAMRFARSSSKVDVHTAKRKHSWVWAAAAVVLLAGIVGGGVILLARDTGSPTFAPPAVIACNGSPLLCDRRLNEVVFPTTHNSMSAADIANWMFPQQERGIREQLEDGIRGLLIDVHYGEPVAGRIKTILDTEVNSRAKYEAVLGKEGMEAAMRIHDRLVGKPEGPEEVYLAHGFCELGSTRFVDALKDIKDFLDENPHEVLIIVIQDEGVKPADVAACFEKSGLVDDVYRGPVTPPWPTLAEMISQNQRVLVLAENHAEGVPWYHVMNGVIQETPYSFHSPEEFSNRPNRGGTNGSLLLMNHWIETAPASKPSNAEIVNAYDVLYKRARACRRERRMLPNLVAVDFYRTGDLFKVCRALNGIPETDSSVVAAAPTTIAPSAGH
jgi:hypothetical protein